jgi:MoxR-like ATPase
MPTGVDDVIARLAQCDYLADDGLATSIYLALAMQRPLFLEGEAGVGKTEVAKTLATMLGTDLIRLQCYEGIDSTQAVYEWDYGRQLLHLRTVEARHDEIVEDELYSQRFLVRRPLLQAIEHREPAPVLLIDEIDRADDEFEAFLLEVLADWAISIPEIGTLRASTPPVTILTSNRTRDVHDALKRRCLYHWIEHPGFERETEILRRRAPQVPAALSADVAAAAAILRGLDLYKPPGVAESIDWAVAVATLGRARLDEATVERTLGTVLKYREDQSRVRDHGIGQLVANALARSA